MSNSDLLLAHQENPKNLGKLIGATAIGEVGSIVVGDALRLYLKIEDNQITESRFQVFAARSMIASASALTEMLVGKTLEEALALTVDDICLYLDNIDRARLPLMPWGLEALHLAIAKNKGIEPQVDRDIDRLICRCHGITEQSIREAVEEDGITDVAGITAETQAGSGCGTCTADIQQIINEVLRKPEPASPMAGAGGRIALMRQMQGHIQTIQDSLEGEAHIELWDVKDTTVIIRGTNIADPEKLAKRIEMVFRDEVDATLSVEVHE